MYACIDKTGDEFSKACAHSAAGLLISTTHPHRLPIRELTCAMPLETAIDGPDKKPVALLSKVREPAHFGAFWARHC
jgi:hypothetical protein